MNAAAALLLIDIISPRRALPVSQQPTEPQIREGARFMNPEASDERNTTP